MPKEKVQPIRIYIYKDTKETVLKHRKLQGYILFLCAALLCFFLIFTRNYICIWGNSMLPTLKPGQLISCFQDKTPDIGDIVVLKVEGKQIIKRVIALPGDAVTLNNGILFRNGIVISENYALLDATNYGPIIVPAGHLFVLGDNRAHSKDSRQIGCISIDSYRGTVILPK